VQYNPSNEPETAWYPASGFGSGAQYVARSFMVQANASPSQYTVSVRLLRPDGSGPYTTPVTWRKARILLIPG
jgi:hypothetical protein